MNNILIGDDVINLDSVESVHRSYANMTVTVVFPSNLQGENYLSYTGPEAEAVWTYLTKHPDTFSLNKET